MQVHHLHVLHQAAEQAFRPGQVRRRGQAAKRPAGGCQHAERPAALGPARGFERRLRPREAHLGERGTPERQRAGGHLLQRHDVRADGRNRFGLLRLSRYAAGDVPGDEAQGLR